jgi:acyl-CoA thioester hydrolase
MDIKIYYEDTDAGGVVYYANCLRFMERGRTEYLDSVGISLKDLMGQGTLFAVNYAEIFYRSYAQYGDTITVESRITEVTAATFAVKHRLVHKGAGRLIVEGKTRLVCVSLTGKPKRLPEEVKKRLDAQAAADGQP